MAGAIPRATVARLPLYLQCLEGMHVGQRIVSSEQLGRMAGVNSAKVRKDLSHLGPHGTRGVGYDAEELRRLISQKLGRTGPSGVAIVGAGNLGQALAGYDGFDERGFRVAAIFDTDTTKIGESLNGILVEHIDEMADVVKDRNVSIGIITTPPEAAQEAADRLAAAGVRSILNFAPAVLRLPPGVEVRRVDLATELQILGYYQHVSS